MAEIISINKARMEVQDDEDGVYAAREDDGELKDIRDWDADDWQGLFEQVLFPIARESNRSIYDLIADFMHTILSLEDSNDE